MSRVYRYLDLAAQVSRLRSDERRYFIGCVGLRRDGPVVMAYNGAPKEPDRLHHAEYRLCRKLDVGSEVYIARTLADGTWANSRPCPDCYKVLKNKALTVYYTLGPKEYGVITLGR